MTESYTIAQTFTLPSEGEVYKVNVTPEFKIRSMTTVEEMKRLNHSDKPYQAMSEIIDDCLVNDIGISAYDLCVADYQYLLHKLRIVTYGPNYKIDSTCPYCGTVNKDTLNLDALTLKPFDKDVYEKYQSFTLPSTGKEIKLRLQTPRILDQITVKTKEARRKNHQAYGDPAFLFTLESLIDTIDGERPEEFRISSFIQKLPMMDANYMLRAAQKLNTSFGLETILMNTCKVCGLDYTSNFRTTAEFFGPSID